MPEQREVFRGKLLPDGGGAVVVAGYRHVIDWWKNSPSSIILSVRSPSDARFGGTRVVGEGEIVKGADELWRGECTANGFRFAVLGRRATLGEPRCLLLEFSNDEPPLSRTADRFATDDGLATA